MTKKEMARSLWDMSFGDNIQFTDLYFEKRYTDDNTVAIYDGDQMISVLQLLSYPFLWNSTEVESAYISGACTHTEHRNKGAMHQLLIDSLTKLANEGTPICTLIPAEDWLFDYYAKSGFETVFYNAHNNLDITNFERDPDVLVSFCTELTDEAYSYLDKKTRDRNTVLLHTHKDMEVIIDDLQTSNGVIFMAREKRNITGIAFSYFDITSKTVYLYELLSDNSTIEQEIFKTAAKHFNSSKLTVITPPHHVEKKPFGMLRIVLAAPILEIYAKTHTDFTDFFVLHDAIISENNGTYNIKNGIVSFNKEINSTARKISINELAQLLFGQSDAYMSLMLD